MHRFISLASLLLWICAAIPASAQAQKDVSLKIGGNYFINCKRTIVLGDYTILSVSGDDESGRMVNFSIYGPDGRLDARLHEGSFEGPRAEYYKIQTAPNGFQIVDTRVDRIVLKILRVENPQYKRTDMHVWAEFFLPNGQLFQCSPEESNVPMLQMIKGSTFSNNDTAIQLN
jgi:hypothetical protein